MSARFQLLPDCRGGLYMGAVVVGADRWTLEYIFDADACGAVVLIDREGKKHVADERATSIDEAKRIGLTLAHEIALGSKDPQTPTAVN